MVEEAPRSLGSGALRRDPPAPILPTPPPELLEFLRAPEPRTLLLTGSPGVGKTTLSLSLLAALNRPSFYVSTRVGRGNLLQHFPWLVGHIPPEHLFDLEAVRPPGERQEELIQLADRLTDTVDPLSAGKRLREFLNLPRSLAGRLGEPLSKAGRSLLFVDSWEGLIEPYVHLLGLEEGGRAHLEHGLLSLFQTAGFGLVLCAEEEHPRSLEYLSDGVAELSLDVLEGGVARHLHLRKLRGIPFHRPKSAFTLYGSTFTSLRDPPLRRGGPPADTLLGPASGPVSKDHLTLGIPVLDQAMGPILPGETLLVELESRGSSAPLARVLIPLWVRALKGGWDVAFLTDLAFNAAMVREMVSQTVPDAGTERIRLLPSNLGHTTEELWTELRGTLKPHTAVDLSVRTLTTLSGEPSETLLARLGRLQLLARESQAVLVFVVGSHDAILGGLSSMVHRHLAVQGYHGTLLLGGRNPVTPLVGVSTDPDAPGGSRTQFLPMM